MIGDPIPLWARMIVATSVISTIVCGLILLIGVTAIASALSSTGVNPAAWGVAGTLVGALISASVGRWTARGLYLRQQHKETRDFAVSLHAEIADRAARCVSDFISPWKEIEKGAGRTRKATAGWIAKFRPADPVVYSGVGAKIGLLPSRAIFPVLHFYFRLDAYRREIDSVTADFSPNDHVYQIEPGRVSLVARRLHECIGPALAALEQLKVDTWEEIESEAVATYAHLRASENTLRSALTIEQIPTIHE